MFAIVETGGKQYRVAEGQKIKVEKLDAKEGAKLTLDKILLIAEGEEVKVGAPYVEGVKAEVEVLRQGKEGTKIVFKYHAKTRYRKKKGHRQRFTELKILSIK